MSLLLLLLPNVILTAAAYYDPKNYEDLYDFSDYYDSLYGSGDGEILDDAFGYSTHLLALINSLFA